MHGRGIFDEGGRATSSEPIINGEGGELVRVLFVVPSLVISLKRDETDEAQVSGKGNERHIGQERERSISNHLAQIRENCNDLDWSLKVEMTERCIFDDPH